MRTNYSFKSVINKRGRTTEDAAMTPMIDVIFLLLVFFVATSSFRAVEKSLPSGVTQLQPAAGGPEPVDDDKLTEMLEQVIVKIDSGPQGATVWVNGQSLAAFADLAQTFRDLSQVGADVPVIIDPAPEILSGQVVKAYDWARTAGLPRVYLATRPEAAPQLVPSGTKQ